MKKKQQKKFSKGVLYVALILFAGMFQTSCLDEIVPGNYYTFTGETIADYLAHAINEYVLIFLYRFLL